MSRAKIIASGAGCYAVGGELDMASVPQLWRDSSKFFNTTESALVFDLKAVTRSDSAGLALLIEWVSMASKKNITIRFRNLPAQMWEIAKVSDLTEVIPLEG